MRSACRIVGLARTAFVCPPVPPADADAPIIAALATLEAQEHRPGFWTCRNRLRNLGLAWNHERIYRVYCALKLKQVRNLSMQVRRSSEEFTQECGRSRSDLPRG